MPRLKVKVVGNTFANRCGNNSPTHMRGAHYIISCSLVIKFPTLFTYKKKT